MCWPCKTMTAASLVQCSTSTLSLLAAAGKWPVRYGLALGEVPIVLDFI